MSFVKVRALFSRHLVSSRRFLHRTLINCEKREHPLRRTIRILSEDFHDSNSSNISEDSYLNTIFPQHADVLIIGGGAIGSSIAYFLKEKTGVNGLKVVVLEKDLTYKKCSTALSVGGLRQQFSLPENIQMSLFGAEFIRTLKSRFGPEADVYFTPNGYLMLASVNGAQQLLDNSKVQNELGAVNTILSKSALKERFPWLEVDDIEIGCLGLKKEGWFDPWAMLNILKSGAMQMGAQYVNGEVIGFTYKNRHDIVVDGTLEGTYEGLDEVLVKLPDGDIKSIQFAYVVLAAGAESGAVAKLARIGEGSGLLSVPLPVERRKRYVYCFDSQGEGSPGLNAPLMVDLTGTYFRREGLGGSYICGRSPLSDEEPDTSNLDVDHEFFDENVWPILAKRIPAFNSLKVRSSWGGYYDYNTFDKNGIIGPHIYYHNLYVACGFSGHGIQQSPAVGRAIAEHILDGDFQTIDLTRLGYNRLVVDKPMLEACIV